MSIKAHIILAFILSPLAAILTYQLFVIGWVIWPIGVNIDRVVEGIMLGIAPMIILYFLLIFISVPIFWLVRYLFVWNLGTCMFSSILVAIVFYMLFLTNIPTTGEEYFFQNSIMAGGVIGVLVYGLAFWLLACRSVKELKS